MLDERQSCNQEEVNYTLSLQTYAYDASQKGFRKLSIITVGSDVVVIALRYLFFTLFQWTLGRIWSWSTSKIYSDTWNYLLFRWRIWWINTILVCINWSWHSFAVLSERKTNCMTSFGKLLWSNGDISEVCCFVY